MIRLGQRLIHARKIKRVTIQQAARELKIRPEFLDALENGEYQKLPSSAYATGFVGNYAQYLGLPKQETLAMFRREFDEKRVFTVLPEEFTKRKEFKVRRFHFHQTFSFLAVVTICIIGYILFQYRSLFLAPSLEVYSPLENDVVAEQVIVNGKADSNATVLVNNTAVTLNSDGTFSKQLSLFEGKTQVEVSATNRFGKKTLIERHIQVKGQSY